MMMYLPTELFDKFQELIYSQSSLRFSPSRLINLEMQLRKRVIAREINSFEEYFQLLQKDLKEFDVLIEGITTKETHFFRLPGQFKALREMVFPQIEERLSEELRRRIAEGKVPGTWKAPLRIWSAGCATGEEPYSIAMTIMEGLKYPQAWNVEILATDISQEAVAAACLAYYETRTINRIPANYQEKYVTSMNGGGLMADKLCKMIYFRIFNLRNASIEKEMPCILMKTDGSKESLNLHEYFDVIFCRNVMIYFDFAAQQRLVDDLYACLKPGGYLFTGDAELLHIYEHDLESVEETGAFFYRKPNEL